MDNFQVKICKVKEPPGLLPVQFLSFVEVGQVFVVSKDLYGEEGAMEVVSPWFQGADDYQEFSIIDVIVSFAREEGLGQV